MCLMFECHLCASADFSDFIANQDYILRVVLYIFCSRFVEVFTRCKVKLHNLLFHGVN